MIFLGQISFLLIHFVLSDITSPVSYQPIKYSHIRMEISYVTNNVTMKKEFEFTHQNTLVTVINSKKSVHISGRLLVVKNNGPDHKVNGSSKSRSSRNDACSRITTFSDTQWIALVLKGGHCSMKEKLDNVLLRSNASAVVILDNSLPRNFDKYEFHNEVGLLVNDLVIPRNILLNDTIYINASITVNNYYVDGLISRTSVLFVSISFILLMVISLVWLIFYYIQRFRYIHAKERLSRRLANAAKKALDKIPLKILSAFDNEVSNDYDQCAICIDSYNVGETIRILPCKHIFHKVCIDSWLIEQRSCPMCKVDILKACGVMNIAEPSKARDIVVSSIINQGLWVRGATVTGTAALLEVGLSGEALAIDTLESHPNLRCCRGHSTFLQRYRERYGLYHCHRGNRREHFDKLSRHFHQHPCRSPKNKAILLNNDLRPNDKVYTNNEAGQERIELISESEHSIVSQQDTSLCLSIPEDKNFKFNPGLNCKQQDLHEVSNSLVYDICEYSSDNVIGECDVCDQQHNNSTKASTACSCESCADCQYVDTVCDHYNLRRNNQNQGSNFGNLLKCCMTSDTNINTLPNDSILGLCGCNPCLRCRSSTCSSCNSKASPACKNYSQSCHTKLGNCHFNCHLKTLQYSQKNAASVCLRPTTQSRPGDKDNYECVKRLKSMMLVKSINKSGTLDSYTKSSISDDFDYEADNGSSSLEITVPAVKLTVLPPQVQCHQGPSNNESCQSTLLKSQNNNDDNNSPEIVLCSNNSI